MTQSRWLHTTTGVTRSAMDEEPICRFVPLTHTRALSPSQPDCLVAKNGTRGTLLVAANPEELGRGRRDHRNVACSG